MCDLPGCTVEPGDDRESIHVSLTTMAAVKANHPKTKVLIVCGSCYEQLDLLFDDERLDREQARAEFETVRESGECNMMDVQCVRREARRRGLEQLQRLIAEDEYFDFLEGYE